MYYLIKFLLTLINRRVVARVTNAFQRDAFRIPSIDMVFVDRIMFMMFVNTTLEGAACVHF